MGARVHFAGGIIWFALGGGWTALVWLIGAAVFGRIAGGQPLARAAIELAGFSISPSGRTAVHIGELGGQDPAPSTAAAGVAGFAFNVLWMLTFGLLLSFAYLVLGFLCGLTVRGLSLGRQCFRLARISLWPVGQRIISTDLTTISCQQAAVERFARAHLRQSTHSTPVAHSGNVPPAAAR